MIRLVPDPDQDWQARLEAEQAREAMKADRHARNAENAFWINVIALVAMGVLFVASLVELYRSGLFDWLKFF